MLRASLLYCDSDRGLTDEAKQTPCPCQSTYRVGPSAGPVRFFSGQKLTLVCKMFDPEQQAVCHFHKVILFNRKRRFCRGFSYVIACCTVAQCESLAKRHGIIDRKSTVAIYTFEDLKNQISCVTLTGMSRNWRFLQ